jgi:hypothetical protein
LQVSLNRGYEVDSVAPVPQDGRSHETKKTCGGELLTWINNTLQWEIDYETDV